MVKVLKEEFTVPAHDANGGGVMVPDPVDTNPGARVPGTPGAPGAPDAGGVDTVTVPGVGEVSRAETLKALLMKLSSLPPDVLAKIANEMDAETDRNINPSGATDGDVGINFASINSADALKEDINEIFAGSELSEEFKTKAAVIFEAVLQSRLTIEIARLEEESNTKLEEAIEQVTEQITDSIDRYLTHISEEFVEENKPILEETFQSNIAEEFMKGVLNLAEQFNIDLPDNKLDVVEELTNQVEALQQRLNEQLDESIEAKKVLLAYEKNTILSQVSEGLTLTQRDRLRQLSETVESENIDEFRNKLTILHESINSTTTAPVANSTVLVEEAPDGVVNVNDTATPRYKNELTAGVLKIFNSMERAI